MHTKSYVLLLLLGMGICGFAQEKGFSAHEQIKPKTEPLKPVNYQQTLGQLFEAAEKAITPLQKARQYFLISRSYSNMLKIDSALYFADKIKELDSGELIQAMYFFSRYNALFYRNQHANADDYLKAIAVFEKNKDVFMAGLTRRHLARQYDSRHEFAASRKQFHVATEQLAAVGEWRELQRSYYELGKSFFMTYEIDSSAFYLHKALKHAEELQENNRVFLSAGFLGELYLVSGNFPAATKYLKYALDMRIPQSSRVEVRSRLASYAACLAYNKDFQKAEEILKEYEELNNKLGDDWGAVMRLKLNGVIQFYKGNYAAAVGYLQQCWAQSKAVEAYKFDTKNIAFMLARAEYEVGDYDNTIKHARIVSKLAGDLQFTIDQVGANQLIADSYEKKGILDSAFFYAKLYHNVQDSLSIVAKEKAVAEVAARYETEKKEQQIQLLEKEKDLYGFQLRLKGEQLEKQQLLDSKKSQELALLSQQNEINKLEASSKTLALENQEKEIGKKQNELRLLSKENELQAAIVKTESQRKNYAYASIIGILLLSAFIYYRSYQNKKLSKRLAISLSDLKQAQEQLIRTEKEKEAENIRVRISRDIHDEVGATLSGVALFSEIAKQKVEQRQEQDASLYLQHITDNSKEMVEKMSDIVWAINPQNDSFDRIIAKLESYAFNLCAGKGIRLHLDIGSSIRTYYPGMQVRKNIYMLMKEAINNAVKYSGCKNIYLSLQNSQGHLVSAEVRDDGKGFDMNAVQEGNGLNNIRARAEELHAKLSIDTAPGLGTAIRLQFEFHPAGGHLQVV
jgi:signal transduction histidine kinase/tetratricopeptide (TPR) repeat protein